MIYRFYFLGGMTMNIQAYFMIIWYILMLPIVFKVLMSLRLEQLFKKGTGRQEIILLYMILKMRGDCIFLLKFFVRN